MKRIELKCGCGASITIEEDGEFASTFSEEQSRNWLERHAGCVAKPAESKPLDNVTFTDKRSCLEHSHWEARTP